MEFINHIYTYDLQVKVLNQMDVDFSPYPVSH